MPLGQGVIFVSAPVTRHAHRKIVWQISICALAFALYGVAFVVAPTIGPSLGGWITDNWSWHWIFFINVPVGTLSLILVRWLLVEPKLLEQERRQLLAGGLKVASW
jgi:MFS family permease